MKNFANDEVVKIKKIIIAIIGVLSFLIVLSGCVQTKEPVQQTEQKLSQEFYEQIPIIDAYYNGEKIWFIHTDVTNLEMVERLTKMVNYKTLYAPKNKEVVDIDKLAKLYIFTNGIDQSNEKPWGGGPFNYQIDIFDSIPGDDSYTSLRNPYLVTWNEGTTPRILKTEEELLAAKDAGELKIKKTDVVVNAPIVRWPGGRAQLN